MDDVVSRQTVKRQMIKYGFHAHDMTVTEFVEDLPSVNPQKSKIEPRYCDRNICLRNEYNSIGCNECEVTKSQESNTVIGTGDGAYYRIKALQAQADGEYILKKDVMGCIGQTSVHSELARKLRKLPSVAIPNKVGHWKLLDECSNAGYYCSECKKRVVKEGWSETVKRIKFCPNCGAKMD